MKKIKLKKGVYTYVDDDDYARFKDRGWYLLKTGYVAQNRGSFSYLHREIMNAPSGMVVDHIDHDKLDNRKINLRLCKHSENCRNSRKNAKSSSRYKGVGKDKRAGNWRAFIMKDRKYYHLGNFENEIEAAKAYNAAAEKYHGEFALLNKVED